MPSTQPPKLCPKIILEGTRLTRKTEIAFRLNEHPRIVGPRRYRYHSPIISAGWCGFTNRPWGRGLINFRPDEAGRAMETYRTWVRLFELLQYYSWIVDRFIREQKAYLEVVRTSSLPHLEVNVSDGGIERICGTIADWLEENELPGFPQ